jgi:broad specificity phosphatase PhoE
MVGWSDVPADLSDTDQINRLSDALPDAPVASSDLIRAVATADAVQQSRPRLPHQTGLREIHFGEWELKSFAEVEAETPDLIHAYWEEPGLVKPPGGESWHEVSARVNQTVDTLLDQTEGDLIIVAHFGAILTQVQRALHITPYEAFGHRIDNLSLTEIVIERGRWSAPKINHLP